MRGVGQRIGWRWSLQKRPAELQRIAALRVGQKSEVADFDKTGRRYVEEEPADKLHGVQRHELDLIAVGRVSPAKGNLAILQGHEAPIGDGNPVGVAGQVFKDLLGPAKWLLGMDHPLLVFEFAKEPIEFRRLPKPSERTGQAQFVLAIGATEQSQKGAAEACGEHLAWQEIAWIANPDPARVIGRESAGGDQAVQMDVGTHLLVPGVEYGQEAKLRAESVRVGGNGEQGLRNRAK